MKKYREEEEDMLNYPDTYEDYWERCEVLYNETRPIRTLEELLEDLLDDNNRQTVKKS